MQVSTRVGRSIAVVVLVGTLTSCSDDNETSIATDETTTTTEATTTTTTTAPPLTTTTTALRTTTTGPPTTTTAAAQQRDCDPSYPDVCIASPPPDLDCPDVQYKNFRVVNGDPHGFDRDNDGIGCES